MISETNSKASAVMLRNNKLGEHGFTLLEVMFCICLLSTLLLVTPRLQPLFFGLPKQKSFNEFEWVIFLQQAQMEYREARTVQFIDKKLMMKDPNGFLVTYTPAGTQLIRKVNSSGNEILLQNVKTIFYKQSSNKLMIHIQDLDGKIHKGILTRLSVLEGT